MNTLPSQLDLPPGHCPPRIDSVEAWKQVQLVMSAALFRPLTRNDDMQPRQADGRPTHEVVEEFILPNDRMSAFERLEVYNRQYWYRLLDCLHEDYPGLRALLGESQFHRLCRDYLAACPSESWTLRNLGSRLVDYLKSQPARWNPALHAKAVDVARTEWAQTLAFDEAARSPVRGDDLLGADPAVLKLGVQPYLSLLELDHAVDRFMHHVRRLDAGLRGAASHAVGERPSAPELPAKARRSTLRREKLWLVVHRYDNAIYFKRLERETYLLLRGLRAGLTLADATGEALEGADPDRDWSVIIQGAFANWAALGWLCEHEPMPAAPPA